MRESRKPPSFNKRTEARRFTMSLRALFFTTKTCRNHINLNKRIRYNLWVAVIKDIISSFLMNYLQVLIYLSNFTKIKKPKV
jgi:hypothetical protein